MRIKLEFLLKKNELPVEYRKAIMYYLKNTLNEMKDVDAYGEFYGQDLTQKNLTFAMKLQLPKFEGNTILLANNIIEMNLSTSSLKKTLILNNGLSKMLNKEIPLGTNNWIKLININVFEGKKIIDNKIIIKMMSPLCIREHTKGESDFYYSVKTENFYDKANGIIKEQIKNELGIEKFDFYIEKFDAKKTVVKHYNQKIECSLGEFKLSGKKEILQHLYDNGIGSRKSAGFGMFEIL